MPARIHVLGPTYIDHTIRLKDQISLDGSARIQDEKTYPGGTGLCYAIALSRLGNQVILHSVVGTDEKADDIQIMVFSEENLQAEWQQIDGKTDYAYILIDRGNHKTVASRKQLTNLFNPEEIGASLQDARAVVLTSFRNDVSERVLKRIESAKNQKPFIMWAPHLPNCQNASALVTQLSLVDHITLSADEFNALYEQIGNPIDHGVKSVTVTNGKNGCDLLMGESLRHYNAIQVVENPFDTNGTGEAFGAGFLTALLETNNYDTAVRAGSYVGFLHVHRPGSDFPKVQKQHLLSITQLASDAIVLPKEMSQVEPK